MLDYLVTSKARRRLLTLLWGENAAGSATELARQASVAFASVHRELQAMKALGLVESARESGAEVFRANRASPFAPLLRQLVKTAARRLPPPDDAGSRRTRGRLRTLGAPLHDAPARVDDAEEALVRGVQLSHRDATVARVLPVCLYRQRDSLCPELLERQARQLGEKRALGFFLDLTAKLSGDRRFADWAVPLRDRRYAVTRDFFPAASRAPAAQRAAQQNTPVAARRWKLRVDVGLDAFQSTFERFAHGT